MQKLQHAILASLILLPLSLAAQGVQQPTSEGLVIRLEQLRNDKVIPVRPEHVFAKDDVLRFRLTSTMDGFVYVVDHQSSGEYTVLLPSATTTAGNNVSSHAEFYVPSPSRWMVPGRRCCRLRYDLLSAEPVKLDVSTAEAKSEAKSKEKEKLPTPCCRVAMTPSFRLEESASIAQPVLRYCRAGAALPPQISTAAPNASRDLVLVNDENGDVKVTKTSAGPAVYVFRIAHK